MTPNRLRCLIWASTLLGGAAACAHAPYQYQPPAATTSVAPPSPAPQLLFLSFRMVAPAQGARRIELIQAQAVPGQVPAAALQEEVGPAYLLLTQLDGQGRACGTPLKVPHPLLRDAEAPTATDPNRLQRELVALPEAEFFVRLARQPQARSVRVAEQGAGLEAPIAVSFPLTL